MGWGGYHPMRRWPVGEMIRDMTELVAMAEYAAQAGDLVPAHIRSPAHAVVVIQAGAELGLPPMAALRGVQLIKGKVTLAADVQLALMIRAGVRYRWVEATAERAELRLQRHGQDPHSSVFTIADAKRAGLNGDNWRKYPAAMLRARAISAAGRAYMPDVLAGVYTPEELTAAGVSPGGVVVVPEPVTAAEPAEVVLIDAAALADLLIERAAEYRRDMRAPGDVGCVAVETAVTRFFGGDPTLFAAEKVTRMYDRLRAMTTGEIMDRLSHVMPDDITAAELAEICGEGAAQGWG